MDFLNILFFTATAGLNATAQLLLKKGALALGPMLSGPDPFLIKVVKVVVNPFVALAIISLGAGILFWMKILSRVELSSAYPINIALTVIIVSTASIFLFQESATPLKIGGIILVIIGLFGILSD